MRTPLEAEACRKRPRSREKYAKGIFFFILVCIPKNHASWKTFRKPTILLLRIEENLTISRKGPKFCEVFPGKGWHIVFSIIRDTIVKREKDGKESSGCLEIRRQTE